LYPKPFCQDNPGGCSVGRDAAHYPYKKQEMKAGGRITLALRIIICSVAAEFLTRVLYFKHGRNIFVTVYGNRY
jgi:hypothetical protein